MNINTDDNLDNDYGRRIIDLKTLGKNMFCSHCEFLLSLTDLVSENRIGVASILYIKCRMYKKITGVSTDKQHSVSNSNSNYDSNTQPVIGSMNSGVGNTHINEVFTVMNIPQVNWKNFKTHENEVIQGVESMAKKSCLAAAKEERQLTIENNEQLKTILCPDYHDEFLFPSSSKIEIQNKNISDDHIVRVAVSFDMGWFTRGTRRTYDSLSGTGALIGAKAMELHAAVALTKDNPILQACNIEAGIFITDNDSSSICAIRAVSHHEVLKQSDKNHIFSKAQKSRLYSKSPIGDGRVACLISKKHLGEKYVNDLTKNLKMSSGIHRDKFCNDVDLFNNKKYANSLTRAAKSRRVALKKSKTALKNRYEAKEGTTYERNIGLRDFIHESIPIVTIEVYKAPIIVFFDLETGSFSKTSDILQIAAKHKQYEFSVYVKPTQTISEEASKVYGLR
ncbi:hypothetical protein KQX54_012096 [Cotesia glomerata]|uniref:Mutator-like transposase domain-containing protein n=1 Tax=Cotesia glomerata TaxID=32391 RepID=A0AAV7IJA7_COTGL|nr:hypothetical protein KQX54_012096 [Cotesia glomerata]